MRADSPVNSLLDSFNGMTLDQAVDAFEPSVWNEPLLEFCKALNLTISLFDSFCQRRCLIAAGPIGERLMKSEFWSVTGLGSKIDRTAAKKCLIEGKNIYQVELEMFSHLAIPIHVNQVIVGVFVVGWVPERFADPVTCDHVAKKIDANSMEIWQLMRMQQPMSQEKLESHGRVLQTFSAPLVRQLMVRIEDQKRALRSRLLAATTIAFAEAKTENELCQTMFKSIRSLVKTNSTKISLFKMNNEIESTVVYNDVFLSPDQDNSLESKHLNHLGIPIPSARAVPSGKLDIAIRETDLSAEQLNELIAIAGQFGTALQKVNLIHALEGERSALKGANIQLQHLHKMKDEFLATVSHELRTPLNAILGWAQILAEDGPEACDFVRAISTIERNAKNQSRLIEDLLDVSRIISGKMTLHREDLEMTKILRESIETVRPMLQAKKQKVHSQISDVPIYFKGDATRATQIFWNLLSNASKFTPEGGDISVVLENAGHYFRLEISDTGKGISAEFLPHLFDRFSQADGSNTRRHGGLGLGLAIVRHLVELHGGTVRATSKGEGQGSVFTVFIPQNTTDKELDNAQDLTRFVGANLTKQNLKLNGIKVLLIDDEPDALRLARFVLEKNGAQIQMADSAAEGFQFYKSGSRTPSFRIFRCRARAVTSSFGGYVNCQARAAV